MNRYFKIIPVLVSVMLLFGCGKKSEIVNSDLALALSENVSFTEQLTEINSSSAQKRYMLNSDDYTEITALVGTLATCDELVIIKTENTENVTEKLNEYIAKKQKKYNKYRPSEAAKLDNPIIEVYNNAVVMIITDDSENAINVYEDYLKN